jgi:diguanylate cyclase (GGDEF)-like protein
VITGVSVPLELALILCFAGLALGFWAGRRQTISRLDPRRSPLARQVHPAMLFQAVDLAARRNADRAASQAVLHGQIDQLMGLHNGWDSDIREQVQGHVAAIMRAGLRRGDSFAVCDRDQFTITIPGADERTAARIADRLRRSLAGLHLPQLGSTARVTASFGVAAEQFEVAGDALVQRARHALKVALEQGDDHVITASAIEEVIMLPPPAPAAPQTSAA